MSNVQILTLMPKKIEFLFEKNSSTHHVQKILVFFEQKMGNLLLEEEVKL